MTASVNKYVAERAELLARLVLTRRKDIRIVTFSDRADLGIDMIVRLLKPVTDDQVYPYLGVVIMGTSESLEDEEVATKYANRGWKHHPTKALLLFPTLVLLFSVEGDIGYYGWLVEPQVSSVLGPNLTRVTPLRMAKIGKNSVDEIIDRVTEWFEAMGTMFVKHASVK
ncbi:MAG: hypothetical protein L0Z62_11555 [Gemmataceae bacterium]|nr:hypothetical protein [Gemmataceae bacterium]